MTAQIYTCPRNFDLMTAEYASAVEPDKLLGRGVCAAKERGAERAGDRAGGVRGAWAGHGGAAAVRQRGEPNGPAADRPEKMKEFSISSVAVHPFFILNSRQKHDMVRLRRQEESVSIIPGAASLRGIPPPWLCHSSFKPAGPAPCGFFTAKNETV